MPPSLLQSPGHTCCPEGIINNNTPLSSKCSSLDNKSCSNSSYSPELNFRQLHIQGNILVTFKTPRNTHPYTVTIMGGGAGVLNKSFKFDLF